MTKHKILYLDDEPINLLVFEQIFKTRFEVLTAENSKVAMNYLEENNDIAFLIADMEMPDIQGTEFIKKVKTTYPELPCAVLTAYNLTDEIVQALESQQIVKHFNKPLDRDIITTTILKSLS